MPVRYLKREKKTVEDTKCKVILEAVQEDLQSLVDKMESALQNLESNDLKGQSIEKGIISFPKRISIGKERESSKQMNSHENGKKKSS